MCGRFTLRTPASAWCQTFFAGMAPEDVPAEIAQQPPRYNIAPTQSVTCVLRESVGSNPMVASLRWGLIPAWADDPKIGNRMINARAETVDTKPSFRKAFARQRCIVIADGYYEWQQSDTGKQPILIEPADGGILMFAGLWEQNRRLTEDQSVLRSCTIITTAARGAMAGIHDRMPIMLLSDARDRWLDPAFRDTDQLNDLLRSSDGPELSLTPVSQYVNNPRHDGPACVEAA